MSSPKAGTWASPAPDASMGSDSASRRAWLLSATDRELRSWLMTSVRGWRDGALDGAALISQLVGAPIAEVVASPFSLRACALGARVGAVMVHHELRPQWRWNPELLPGPGAADEDHGQWLEGVLHTGRFEGFCQDQPFAGYNPNHSARWTPHELLHRACGFAFKPGMSRWWLYGAARLGEVLPVAHWYGTDDVFRLDGDGFDRVLDAQNPTARMSEVQWLDADESQLERRAAAAVEGLRRAARWLDNELAAVFEEQQLADTVHVPNPLLDSVSDAIAYTAGHTARLHHVWICKVLTTCTEAGAERFDDLRKYGAHIAELFDTLVFGDITVDAQAAQARQWGRALWDLSLTSAMCDPLTSEELCAHKLRDIATALDSARRGEPTAARHLFHELRDEMVDAGLGDVVPLGALATGLSDVVDWAQLHEGLQSAAPIFCGSLDANNQDVTTWLATLPKDRIWARGPLVQRLRAWSRDEPLDVRRAAALSELILGVGPGDDVIERLCKPSDDWPELLAGYRVRASRSFAVHTDGGGHLIGRFMGAVSILPAPSWLAELWRALEAAPVAVDECLAIIDRSVDVTSQDPQWPQSARAWLEALAEAGAIGLVSSS